MPALHEAMHARLAPHRHVGNTIVMTSFEDTTHVHADGTIHYVAPKHDDGHRRYHVPIDEHNADGLAHHAVALHAPPPPLRVPPPVPSPAILVVTAQPRLVSLDPLAPKSRGPPVVAFA
jgi:hypothetical protein